MSVMLVTEPEHVNPAMEMMKPVRNAMVLATAPSVTVPARLNMSSQGEPENEQARVARLLDMHRQQLGIAEQVENQLIMALWDLRGSHKVDDMARWMGCSRQTIYNKWAKLGLKVDDAEPTGDSN